MLVVQQPLDQKVTAAAAMSGTIISFTMHLLLSIKPT